MKIKIIRVLGIRSKGAAILATVDGLLVNWGGHRAWDCQCLTDLDEFECKHIEAIRDLMDDRVLTPIQRRAIVL
ncbi:hypothetical protein [Cryobacterium psychrophilum]|uniref:SWIM-type domain-containing protein n=1 Tax=Cryobacterium psychrophilum TaxID=41988 RepID=A0A4Y8KQW2_9MICO|nr:hypothetical protein [Cryobacterium psychrophilum]TFD80535.1 hypothetical protein E3T53_05535 [Cryobacterium psychrophilum]